MSSGLSVVRATGRGPSQIPNANVEFFENENSKKISTRLSGKGTQMPSPSPGLFSCHENYSEGSFIERAEFMPLSVAA